MASYDLVASERLDSVSLVAAIETEPASRLNLGFWLRDPNQIVLWPDFVPHHPRQDFLWQQTCFEVFIGVKNQDFYREINLGASEAWQAYQFEEYRYPEQIPPLLSHDIKLNQLKRTHYGLSASLDLSAFMLQHSLKWSDLYLGLTAVVNTSQGLYFYALKHSHPTSPDFHNKRDWLHEF